MLIAEHTILINFLSSSLVLLIEKSVLQMLRNILGKKLEKVPCMILLLKYYFCF